MSKPNAVQNRFLLLIIVRGLGRNPKFSYHKAILKEWEGKKLATPPNGKVYLAISPGRGDLKLADKTGPLPKELNGKSLWDRIKSTARELFMAWRDSGLLDESSKTRPTYDVWKSYFDLPLKRWDNERFHPNILNEMEWNI